MRKVYLTTWPADNPKIEAKEQLLSTNERETAVGVVSLWFKPENKWRFTEGGETFAATVTDKEFLRKIASNEIAFNATKLYRVKLKQSQFRTGSGLKTEYEIARV